MFAFFWRDGNVVAFLIGGDTLGDMSQESLLQTAKEIDQR